VAANRAVRTDHLILHPVGYDKLQLTITERGQLESAENSDVICQVKAGAKGNNVATTIKWVIDDGTPVKRDQLLMELDDSGLYDQLKTQEITLDQARAAWIQAEENYKIVISQNHSDIQTAKIAVDLAAIDLEKYLKGDYLQSVKDIQGRLLISESDLEMYKDRAAWSQRMVKKGFLTSSQSQADQSRLQSGQIARDKVVEELRVLEEYTKRRTVTDLENKVEEAKRALDRTEKQANAKEKTADIDRQTKKLVHDKEQARYKEIEDEIKKCTVRAPQDGLVVYYVPEQSRWGSGSQQSIIAQGEPVREGQKMMRIPDLSRMQVNTRVHEAMISRLHGDEYKNTGFLDSLRSALLVNPDALARWVALNAFAELHEAFREQEKVKVRDGQKSLVRIDAYPGKVWQGHVKAVATVAAQQDWSSADVKVYQTIVSIDEPAQGLKPGMSAEVTILTERELDHILTVPVQAIVGSVEMGKKRKCFVTTPAGIEEREVEVGLSNEKMAEIKTGLAEGELVVLNPRTLLSERVKDSRSQAGAEKGEKGEKGGKGGPGEGKGGRRGKGGGLPGEGGKGGGFPGRGGE
jgi:multidrug efflux pump subunit AcrA (membrane-fusion protein)